MFWKIFFPSWGFFDSVPEQQVRYIRIFDVEGNETVMDLVRPIHTLNFTNLFYNPNVNFEYLQDSLINRWLQTGVFSELLSKVISNMALLHDLKADRFQLVIKVNEQEFISEKMKILK